MADKNGRPPSQGGDHDPNSVDRVNENTHISAGNTNTKRFSGPGPNQCPSGPQTDIHSDDRTIPSRSSGSDDSKNNNNNKNLDSFSGDATRMIESEKQEMEESELSENEDVPTLPHLDTDEGLDAALACTSKRPINIIWGYVIKIHYKPPQITE